jgi:lysophospholipase L1-like esterase
MSSPLTAPARVVSRSLPARRSVTAIVMGLLGLAGLDALLFRTPLYPSILSPDSSTGIFEMTLRRERQAQATHGDNLVVTLGDSRFAYSNKIADTLTHETGLVVRHAGVAGTDARSWYYMLRDLDPKANRYRAVIFGTPDYDDEDEFFNPFDDIRALHYTIARLRWTDAVPFALSFQDPELRWQALRGAMLKGTVLQRDIFDFLNHPQHRLEYVALCRRGWAGWTYDYQEATRSMAGLKIDWATRTATLPPDADENQRETIQPVLSERAAQTGRLAAYRRQWFGKIIARYRASRTKVIFVRLPRGPIPRPEGSVRKLSSSIREFAAIPNVMLADEHAFESLERPELFKDGIHLNRAGIAAFTPMLAREISRMLAR